MNAYTILVANQGKTEIEEKFNSLTAVIQYLKEETKTIFGWINDEEPDAELPDFSDCIDARDVRLILDRYDYSWWGVSLIDNLVGKTWGSLSDADKTELLGRAEPIDCRTGNAIEKDGECIFDFCDLSISIPGKSESDHYIIADDAVFYDPTL